MSDASIEATGMPAFKSIDHVSLTVTDIDASLDWYKRVFGFVEIMREPFNGAEESGYAIILSNPQGGFNISLNKHESNQGERFAENRTGLDHFAFRVENASDMETWETRLEELGVEHSPVMKLGDSISLLTLRDPDNIQIEIEYKS